MSQNKALNTDSLSIEELELLAYMLDDQGVEYTEAETITPQPATAPHLLSFAQERLWFLDQLTPGSHVYNIPAALRLRGALDVPALHHSLQAIVQRHAALRTTFTIVNGQPIQHITPDLDLALPVVDLAAAAVPDLAVHIQQLARAEAQVSFDLQRGPLIRASLLRLNALEHVLLITWHHIIADGWSLARFVHELQTIYNASITGQPVTLPTLPIQYIDYAGWQRQRLSGDTREEQLAYWRQELAGAPALLTLPTDRARPAVQTFTGATVPFMLPAELTQQLHMLSRQASTTLFMTLLATWQVLLARYSGQAEVVVGTPIAGRTRSEVEDLIGFFVNTLALRVDLGGKPTFREVLAQVRQTTLGAYAHQEVPFELVVEAVQPTRDLSYNPLFQVMFVFQSAALPTLDLVGIEAEILEIERDISVFDMALTMEETAQGLTGALEYNTDLFDRATISRLLTHFQTLLATFVQNPDQPVNTVPLLTPAELEQTLVTWNTTQRTYPRTGCIHTLIEEQAARTPDHIALTYEDTHLTYAELNMRANQVAHYLQMQGIHPDMMVGICMERSLELVIGLLGILKVGAAYVPLDPEYPGDRIAYMMQDAQVSVLLLQERLVGRVPAYCGRCIALDTAWAEIANMPTDAPTSTVALDNLAYVIYTSGSTGKPKGVMNSHRGLCNRLLWMQEQYMLTEADRVLQKTPFSFDVSVWEFFWPLLIGARLVLCRPSGHRDPQYLIDLIKTQEISTLHFVPAMLQVFLQAPGVEQCTSLRRVICSGEALSVDLQQRFFAQLGAELHNLYGPTEAAIDVTFWECQRGHSATTVPIGRPIANIQLYVLDAHMQPVPAGVPGELYLAGIGLARGYVRRPGLTAEKFVPNPFRQEVGARMYKTGDLVRYTAGGVVEYLGRIDHQIKIRGFRVELEEIESVLRQHESIREAIVVMREDAPGEKRLVSYIVTSREVPLSELRSLLLAQLPEYMVPAVFVVLAALPVTANGKVDRQALPLPDDSRLRTATTYVAPRTPDEAELAAIWHDVLAVERIGIHDNFFELGGHSILLTQLILRIRASFQVELTLRELFDAPTILDMITLIAARLIEMENSENFSDFLAELEHLSPEEIDALLAADSAGQE